MSDATAAPPENEPGLDPDAAPAEPAAGPSVADALADALEASEAFATLRERVHRERRLAVGGLWGSSQSLVLAGLLRDAAAPGEGNEDRWLLIASTDAEAELLAEDLAMLGTETLLLPARESFAGSGSSMHADPSTIRRRLQGAQRLTGPPERRPRCVVASLLSILQPIPSNQDLERDFITLQVGQSLDPNALLERLVESGYARLPLAERPGEVSLRGDILDVFAFASDRPLRIELFDQEIDSLRTFDPESQRSIESSPQVRLCIASDAGGVEDGRGQSLAQLLPPGTISVELEPLRVAEQREGLRIQSSAHAGALIELDEVRRAWRHLTLQSLPASDLDFDTRSVQSLAVGVKRAPAELAEEAAAGARVVVLCGTGAERARFASLVEASEASGAVEVLEGGLARGFRLRHPHVSVVNHRELVGIVGARRRAKAVARKNVRALESFFELEPGDLVVHAVHGVARFVDLERMTRAGGDEEHLHVRFQDDVSLFVPASRIDLVQRYIGSGSAAPELDKIGGQSFRKRKERVERALVDLAAELLEVQARRALRRRDPWAFDRELEREMIAAFPYVDTPDQATVDHEIATDIGSTRPMDRLICGDVGFGKTELAVRAAFRVVSGGGQVAVLVPTTVLAQQHFATFCERLADFPVEVEMLSRYVTGRRARETVQRVNEGKVDILIGTHRILSKDVDFARLGLVVIDEEQRFGVTHKEHFKKLRAQIDLLTMTATPIPRTLHLSLAGLRDISALTEPPEGRQEIETRLASRHDSERIRRALLREHNRGGQVFVLHNRVRSIGAFARELQALVPECSYAVGHGQMSGRDLREIMSTFQRGEVDVLVATTIVENGIDIPAAGTILIDEADHYGLSELHQLRGRVGRGDHKAYCYLLVDPNKPMRDVARERLKAIEELTHLGAGFQISMKDLEIRGAGNILGPQQSGHIAAVGYDMYCRLLHQTVERMRALGDAAEGDAEAARELRSELATEVPRMVTADLEAAAVELELGIHAYLPDDWIEDPRERLELLRKLNTIEGPEDVKETLEMLRDRYGRVPHQALALVHQFELRALLAHHGIRRLAWREETYLIEYSDRIGLEHAFAGRDDIELRPLGHGRGHLVIPKRVRTPERAAAWMLEMLGDEGAERRDRG